jgi:hypothetical protein
LTSTQAIVDWLLGIPTVLLLLVVAGLHVVFYLYLVAVEKQQDIGGQGWQADGDGVGNRAGVSTPVRGRVKAGIELEATIVSG